jgi:hypothetical protein
MLLIRAVIYSVNILKPFIVVYKVPIGGLGG